ncbi:D-alanine--poly(phosphoribitol) ligase subunit DltA [Lactococcus termiticola]|uniref:D-alanine--D-alanyl carrier protein ligase n=1 Tax=Lactococcus termiticola TaxID=2169526 RepID=A0A2R5HK50_9LACT|nr:D-alanine--poly(phosphoribitol) ligase subunit DltA [Lactococcus termiticola]GBG97118.1 D-alanine-activating enzyme DltA [Lactococcus termiticola]
MKLLEQIIDVAKQKPDFTALAEKDRAFSYRELMDASVQIAKLIEAEADSMRPVLVFGRNDFLSLAAMLGTNLTGRAYIPVDAHTPAERTELILSVSQPSVVILTAEVEGNFKQLFSQAIDFTAYQANPDFDLDKLDTSKAVSGSDINYIIYTSGTTGVPKGVAVTHDNLVSFTRWMNEDFVKISDNQILEQPPYSFDLSIFSLYPSLTQGGSLVSLSKDETNNFKLLFERLNSTTINTWISTPSFVDICLLDPSFVEANHPSLQQFIFCGEELTHKTGTKLLKAFPNVAIYNTYGPTEATGAISEIQVTPEILEQYKRVPIGRAKPGVELRIIDKEIVILGDSVAKEYFENPEKTAEAFFEIDGQPAYHTGDAGFIDERGILNYNGRIDFQVKFNGFRIELQDIESHLLGLEQVEKALVLPQENADHKVTGLVAILVVKEESPDRAYTKALKAELSTSIMDYMMPTKFVYVDDFPLNQNGKVDRKALEASLGGKA